MNPLRVSIRSRATSSGSSDRSLSAEAGVTIFLSTHFMNEAERCDRISLMNAGKVLACERRRSWWRARGATNLEEAFIGYMEDAMPRPHRDGATQRRRRLVDPRQRRPPGSRRTRQPARP